MSRERPVKRQKLITLESDQSDYSDSANDEESDTEWDEDEPGFQQLVQKAFDQYDDIYGDKVDKLMEEENITEEAARRDVNDILRSRYRKSLVREYKTFINMTHLILPAIPPALIRLHSGLPHPDARTAEVPLSHIRPPIQPHNSLNNL